ncbi:MAG: VOC family protein [Pseudomonadota bacterium]
MLGQSSVVAFVATANAKQSEAFYAQALGLTKLEDSPFALVFDANGTLLRIQKVSTVSPPPYTVLGWEVDDIESSVRGLAENGVVFQFYEQMPQNDLGIWTSPGGARVAWCKDPDGNILSITQCADKD